MTSSGQSSQSRKTSPGPTAGCCGAWARIRFRRELAAVSWPLAGGPASIAAQMANRERTCMWTLQPVSRVQHARLVRGRQGGQLVSGRRRREPRERPPRPEGSALYLLRAERAASEPNLHLVFPLRSPGVEEYPAQIGLTEIFAASAVGGLR